MKKTTYKSLLAALAALLLAACTQDELMQDNPSATGSRGSLHVTEVTLPEGGMQSRVATDGGSNGVDMLYMPFNVAATGFDIDGDFVTVKYSFGGEAEYSGDLDYTSSEWSFNPDWDSDSEKWNPTRPNQDAANGESWANFSMQAYIQFDALFGESGSYTGGVGYVDDFSLNYGALLEYFTAPSDWTYDAGRYTVNGTILDARMYLDKLVASTEEGGGITADTDLASPTLGSFRVALKHAHAMLRLPKSAITTEPLIVDGQEVAPTFKTLWAELSYGTDSKMYIPLTAVTLSDNTEVYQAIVPVEENEAAVTLTGFQMVYTDGEEGTTPYTHVFDLGDGAVALAANTRYPLTLTLTPRKTEVTLTAPTGKPGWSDENELDNSMNEAVNEVTYTAGTGEAAGTFTISGPNGLQLVNKWMAGNLAQELYATLAALPYNWPSGDEATRMKQNITLAADITLPATDLATGEPITVTDGQPSGSNWTPLGSGVYAYSGTFNGNGKNITGLRIVSNANSVGLVNALGSDGEVSDLTLTDAVVHSTSTNTDQGKNCAGLIVGQNSGTVTHCVISGNSSVKGMSFVGGVVGHNSAGKVISCIVNSASSATGLSNVGGIVGLNDSGGTISGCINQGSATATGYSGGTEYCYAGGIVGANTGGKVSSCQNQSSATVSSDNFAGGIAGDNFTGGTVSESTNAGSVTITGTSNMISAGGIVGANQGASIIVCGDWGTVTSSANAGGIVGNHSSSATATACWTTMNKAIGMWNGGTTSACYYQGTAASNEGDESKYYGTGVQSVNTAEVVNAMNIAIAIWNAANTSNTVAMGWQVSTSYPAMEAISEIQGFPSTN